MLTAVLIAVAAFLSNLWFGPGGLGAPNFVIEQPHDSLLVLKLPRSGSTWFTNLLNGYGNVFVSKEVLQQKDFKLDHCTEHSVGELAAFMAAMLHQPKGKYGWRRSFWPGGRFLDDYIYSGKCLGVMDVIGGTLNPEHLDSLERSHDVLPVWTAVMAPPPSGLMRSLSVVIFERTNVVKAAVSSYRGDHVHRSGCSNNLEDVAPERRQRQWWMIFGGGGNDLNGGRESVEECRKRAEGLRVAWGMAEFAHEINARMRRMAALRASARRLHTAAPHARIATITYEALQIDASDALDRLAEELQLPLAKHATMMQEAGAGALARTGTSKRTSEDLRGHVVEEDAFDALAAALAADPECACIRQQLVSHSATAFDCPLRYLVVVSEEGGGGSSGGQHFQCLPNLIGT